MRKAAPASTMLALQMCEVSLVAATCAMLIKSPHSATWTVSILLGLRYHSLTHHLRAAVWQRSLH